jgi:hypothetical protein
MTKIPRNIIEATLTRINRKKYVNGSLKSEGHLKKIKTRRDALSGLYLYMYDSPFNAGSSLYIRRSGVF